MRSSIILDDFLDYIFHEDQFFPSHITMYLSILKLWNMNGRQNQFRISRHEIMKLSKIKSFATYHKCIKDLSSAGIILYLPSYDSYKGSFIEICDLKKLKINDCSLPQQKKNYFSAPRIDDVILYFNERNFSVENANQFYSFYNAKDWKVCNRKTMKCWRSAARHWMFNLEKQ